MSATEATRISALGEVREVELRSVRPYPGNPRKIPVQGVEQTAKSIRDFGWQQPLVVDSDLVIIAGHTRWAAAKHLGLDTVPVVIADQLTPEQVRAYRIADNRTGDYSSWDYTQLVQELDGLTDFADVLDLADWSGLLKAFEEQGGATSHMLPAETSDPILGAGYVVSVEFSSRAEADRAGPALLELPGVMNVRHPPRTRVRNLRD